jgi:hypothetical protein
MPIAGLERAKDPAAGHHPVRSRSILLRSATASAVTVASRRQSDKSRHLR